MIININELKEFGNIIFNVTDKIQLILSVSDDKQSLSITKRDSSVELSTGELDDKGINNKIQNFIYSQYMMNTPLQNSIDSSSNDKVENTLSEDEEKKKQILKDYLRNIINQNAKHSTICDITLFSEMEKSLNLTLSRDEIYDIVQDTLTKLCYNHPYILLMGDIKEVMKIPYENYKGVIPKLDFERQKEIIKKIESNDLRYDIPSVPINHLIKQINIDDNSVNFDLNLYNTVCDKLKTNDCVMLTSKDNEYLVIPNPTRFAAIFELSQKKIDKWKTDRCLADECKTDKANGDDKTVKANGEERIGNIIKDIEKFKTILEKSKDFTKEAKDYYVGIDETIPYAENVTKKLNNVRIRCHSKQRNITLFSTFNLDDE